MRFDRDGGHRVPVKPRRYSWADFGEDHVTIPPDSHVIRGIELAESTLGMEEVSRRRPRPVEIEIGGTTGIIECDDISYSRVPRANSTAESGARKSGARGSL